MKLISVKPIDATYLRRVIGELPRCEWREGFLRCTSQATARIVTDEDCKELCQHHLEEYEERYLRPVEK